MDSAASFDEDNSDSDYCNVSSDDEFDEEFEEEIVIKRKILPSFKRRDASEQQKTTFAKLNIKQNFTPSPVKVNLKRKISFPSSSTTTTKKENDGGSSYQLAMSASHSPEENSSISISTTPTMELETSSNASLLMPAPGSALDETPLIPEKYGKLCAFCNLGERSLLGQGEMLRLQLSEQELKEIESASPSPATESELNTSNPEQDDAKNGNESESSKTPKATSVALTLQQQLNKRQKGLNKCKNPVQNVEYVDELEKIGHLEACEISSLLDNGYFYVHRLCAMWSAGVVRDPVNETLSGVSSVLKQSLSKKCQYCNHFGASASCKMTCQKMFHYPCVAASGGFQVHQSCEVFCHEHLGQVPLECTHDVNCRLCQGLGDVTNMLSCSLCGDHYHGACIGLRLEPGVRTGWQCKPCRSCQICKIQDNTEGRALACESCDKLYHAQCLRPVLATIPKFGWKCRRCRVCTDCGARTPGAGASSRWHNSYTVCDSCYQQRNKGYSCPVCRKAYRAAAHREMVRCGSCQKYVHNQCDPDANLALYERRKELNPDYEYVCSVCKVIPQSDRIAAMRKSTSGEEDSFSASQESLNALDDVDMESVEMKNDYGLGKGKPFVAGKLGKKRLGLSGTAAARPKGGKLGFQKRPRTFELGRKRGPKSKMRGLFGVPGLGLQRPVSTDSSKNDDEPGIENRLVLCSKKDGFMLTQDICVSCGAMGTDQEGCLIACAQCGQCHHPYCVGVKVTKEILQKGWRCLECTICEGCGEKNDEGRLILCDDCDISYHIYCIEPKLDNVPTGSWKCKWCAACYKCGSSEPGLNCIWQNGYTECGPCSSQVSCPVCFELYGEGELIIQCTMCDRWLHCLCDSIKNDVDAEKCAEEGYNCILCRPKDILPPHLQQAKRKAPSLLSQSSTCKDESMEDYEISLTLSMEGSHFIDGVYLSEHGMQQIKSMQFEQKRAKRKPRNVENEKDAAILAAIESVVAGSADNSTDDIKMEPLDPNEEAMIYKDGMEWASGEPPPEGFSLFTTETGSVVLRKKRQRNLQKLGIGGFSVRNRQVRTKDEDVTSSHISAEDAKKKKPNRRKQKNKLIETYPVYLQDAFFGRSLLDTNTKVKLETDSEDEEVKSTVSEDKTIKLSLEELKMIENMRAKQQEKLLEEQKLLQLANVDKNGTQLLSSGSQIQLNQKMQVENAQFSSTTQSALTPSTSSGLQAEIKNELNLYDDDENNSDAALNDLGLPNDLLDNDLVDKIMNADDDLTKTSDAMDDNIKDENDDLADILNRDFNIDNVMDEMLFKNEESQESQESMMTNHTQYSQRSTPSHQSEQNLLPTNVLPSPYQQAQVPTLMTQNLNQQQMQNPMMTQQMPHMNQPMMMQQQQNPMQMQPNMLQRSASMPTGAPGPLQAMQQRYFPFDNFNQRPPFTANANFANQQPQWNAPNDNDFDMSAGAGSQTPKMSNNQKAAERMAEDEKLGEQSTISAVLYANQNHPELKMEYPNWPDRYKQIMKKWRALAPEMKQPYLQRARDNRSAQQAQLRTKKAQQVAPELSPEGVTTSSTNSTSPALSSTLSESSSLMDVNIMQQQPVASSTPSLQNQADQDKISAQQKSMKEAEQEKQWKALQAMRARESQMGLTNDQRMHHNMNDPNVQLQISTSLNDGSMSPVASPSPNSRNQFVAPANKGRMMINPQSPSSIGFQHPQVMQRPQILQRQQSQQRMNQSPFSPQQMTPQSPHDPFPGSPSPSDGFARPPSEDQFLHSPQTPKPVVQQQSPVHNPTGNFTMNQPQSQSQPPNIRPLDSMSGGYVQAPGTPRPSFNPGQTRTTVYARPDMFSKPPFIPQRGDHFSPPSAQSPQSPVQDQGNNRQLRDLLQRQQSAPPLNIVAPLGAPANIVQNITQSFSNDQNSPQSPNIVQPHGDNTFRQPLPPGMRQQRMQMINNQMIRQNVPGQRMAMNPGPRIGPRPGQGMNPQMIEVQQNQQQNQMGQMVQQQRIMNPQAAGFNQMQQGQMMQQGQPNQVIGANQGNMMPQQMQMQQNIQTASAINQSVGEAPKVPPPAGSAEGDVIPDSVTAELEKLEQDENVAMDGVGDILGGLGDDDDDFLNSLTDGLGADFNILEYADPELEGDDEKNNLLDSLELDDHGDHSKEEKLKNLEAEKLAKAQQLQQQQAQQMQQQQQHIQHQQQQQGVVQQQMQPIQNRIPSMQQPQQNIINQMSTGDGQMPNQMVQQHHPDMMNPGQQPQQGVQQQQVVMNPNQPQQPGMNNFPRQQMRPKGMVNQPSQQEIAQIHHQMMLQLQQAAANGNPMPIGTRLVSNNNLVGTVTGPNQISLSLNSGPNRVQQVQQVRMANPNVMQGNMRMPMNQMQPNHPRQQLIQGIPSQNIPGMQNQVVNQQNIINQQHQQQVQVQQQQQQPVQNIPPPPYPEPPPPYPGPVAGQSQEQPLLLEDLLEQEKREQARHTGGPIDPMMQQGQQSIFNDQDYEKLRAEVMTTNPQNIQQGPPQQLNQGMVQQQIQQNFMPRAGMVQNKWRAPPPQIQTPPSISNQEVLVKSVPIYQANLQSAPPIPPENIVTDQDKIMQVTYETWLNNQLIELTNQVQYYEKEILELRKLKKTLTTKQRQMKKTGQDLNDTDLRTLAEVTKEQLAVQKHLDSSRKQSRSHTSTKQDYENKKSMKQMQNMPQHMVPSPVNQMTENSPMMSPSPGGMNQQMMQNPVQSPLGNPIMPPNQSPLHSPSPMISAQSPGPNQIMQSPVHHMNAMSPYNQNQQSPRIGTPHSQIDDSPFSPNSGQLDSPSLSGRLTSPAPRMTSPQHRPSTPMQMMRQPNQFNQQQNRFVRPQQMIQGDGNVRMAMRMPGNFQQMQQNPNLQNMQNMQNMQNIQSMQNVQNMDQQRQMQIRQMQMRQQMMNQQNQQQMMQQQQQQAPNQSPSHQPQSPLLQNATSPMPRSPMVQHYQQQQNPQSPMMVDHSPRPYVQQQQQQQQQMIDPNQQNQMMQQGGGGGGMHQQNQIPCPPEFVKNIKLGLRGGAPMWGNNSNNGNGKQPTSNAEMLQIVKKLQQQQQAQQAAQAAASLQPSTSREDDSKGPPKMKPRTIIKLPPSSISASKIKSLVSSEYNDDDSSNGTPPISPMTQRVKKTPEDVVVLDSSPEDKQRLTDYDDDNDKVVTTMTEVSLNSTARDIGDADVIMETFNRSELVTSPLVPDTEAGSYALFESHPLDVGNDLKDIMNTGLFEETIEAPKSDVKAGEIFAEVVEVKEKSPKNVDFEAMIDSNKDDDESETEKVEPTETKIIEISQQLTATPQQEIKKEVKVMTTSSPHVSITLPASLISRANMQTTSIAGVSGSKKLVKSAKVSIGNQMISVPVVLKNMPVQNKAPGSDMQQKKIITTSALTIQNLKKNQTMFSVSSGQKISSPTAFVLLNKGTRQIQAVQRIQQKPGQSQSIIMPISSTISTPVVSVSTPTSETSSQILTFSSKLPQDTSLPMKILEDEENPEGESSDKTSTTVQVDDKTKSQIPVHVIVKSSESTTQSAALNPAQRVISGNMSQLSPLSQPIEINTNTHNATQQIRSIMSSINSNEDSKAKTDSDQTSTTTDSQAQNVTSQPSLVANRPQQLGNVTSVTTIPGSVPTTTSGGNILFVKQFRPPSSQPTSTANPSKIVVMSQSGQIQSQGSVIISMPTSNLSALSNQQSAKVNEVKIDVPSSSSVANIVSSTSDLKTVKILKTNPAITNLLNVNSFKRSKSTDDATSQKEASDNIAAKRLSLESSNIIKIEPIEKIVTVKQEVVTKPLEQQVVVKPPIQPPPKKEKKENELLKQLLSGSRAHVRMPQERTQQERPAERSQENSQKETTYVSLEDQLLRPQKPPNTVQIPNLPTSGIPFVTALSAAPAVTTAPSTMTVEAVKAQITAPIVPTPTVVVPEVQAMIDVKTVAASVRPDPIKTPTELMIGMAPPNPTMKKEMISPGGLPSSSPSTTPVPSRSVTTPVPVESPSIEVKKEIMDDSSQSESISSDVSMVKNETTVTTPSTRDDSISEMMDESPAKTAAEIANELKKKKRREYQKNRRQMQMAKEKGVKKPRKLQKNEEDYDAYIDNVLSHMKTLSQMQILEPLLPKNFGVCPTYGSSEPIKMNNARMNDLTCGELEGVYGNAELKYVTDYYVTLPYGTVEPKPEQPATTSQRGFYDQEFSPIKFEEEDQRTHKYDVLSKDRDVDTPETIVSSSSPECVTVAPRPKFPGLKLIREDDEDDESEIVQFVERRMSPVINQIVAPIPIRLKSGMSLSADQSSDKENDTKKELGLRSCFGPPNTLKDSNNNNVTVTLTLTSTAAEDIMGVLKSLANILNIPAPKTYQIVERTTTPPSQKLGLYRLRGKDGKAGQPVDIQTILNGTAKFCRHCDVVILSTCIKAKASDFPLLVNTELEADEFYFCGETCFKQFQWRPINMLDDKNIKTPSDEKALENFQEENIPKPVETAEVRNDLKRKHDGSKDEAAVEQPEKKQKVNNRVKTFCANSFPQIHKYKKMSDREITELLFRMNITVSCVTSPPKPIQVTVNPIGQALKIPDDTRKCIFCHQIGDGVADGPSRLLNYDVDKYVHLNCALWSDGVYEAVNGSLVNLEPALQTSSTSACTSCNQFGATVKCFKARCGSIYHLTCAMKDKCVFYKNKTTMCSIHAPKSEKDNELTTLSVQRKVYIDRDESRQMASIMHHSDFTYILRVGTLVLLNIGQLLPHQLAAFHTKDCIYPIGYRIMRFFWSMKYPNKRCTYICSIADVAGRPEFRIVVKENNEDVQELRADSTKRVWQKVLTSIAELRREHNLVQVFSKHINGDDLFGLYEPNIVRILESLPAVETLTDYRQKYGRNPLLELPLAINPSGAARTEPRIKTNMSFKKPHTQRTGSSSQRPAFVPSTSAGEVACPYSKQFVHSKSSQYKKMKSEWRNNVFLARSKIQGLGLYAARDLEKHTMVIEYIGEVIRGELSELREKQYDAKNRGIYMFRLDDDRVIDATLCGGLARYINHSCNPNCVTEIVEVDREYRIIIFAKRKIVRGEELSYDYKFDIEDESRKISCHCEATNCKKYLN